MATAQEPYKAHTTLAELDDALTTAGKIDEALMETNEEKARAHKAEVPTVKIQKPLALAEADEAMMANAEVKRRNFMVCPITLRGYDRDVDDKGADANIMDRMNSDQRHNEAM